MTVATLLVPDLDVTQRESVLGRTNPLVKLGISLAWLVRICRSARVR